MNKEKIKLPSPEIVGDFRPMVVREPNGSNTYIIRTVCRKIDSLKSKLDKKNQHFAQQKVMAESGHTYEGLPPDYKKDFYSYPDMMPVCGSPESIAMPEEPRLTIGFVRHLKHRNNKVDPEDQQAFIPKAENLIDSLNITADTAVFVVASPASNYEAGADGAIVRNSRTDDTAKVIRDVLNKRGVKFIYNRIENGEPENDVTIIQLKRALDEFPVTSEEYFNEMETKINENIEAQKIGHALPHPDLPTKKPAVYASFAENSKELESKTGIGEVSSATVARTLRGFDAIEDYFLREGNLPDGAKRVVVIMAGHGQFGSDISEALLVATDKQFPFIAAGNGAYFKINVDLAPDNRSIREFIINDQNMKG